MFTDLIAQDNTSNTEAFVVVKKISKKAVLKDRPGVLSQKAFENMYNFLQKEKFEILSVSEGTFDSSSWCLKCENGHTFIRKANKMRDSIARINAVYCPHCWKSSSEEEYVRLLLEEEFKKPFPNIRPSWMHNESTGYALELDMFNEDMMLAVEYNGIHHYEPIFGEDSLASVMKKDILKQELCLQSGVHLIQIKAHKKKLSMSSFIDYIVNVFQENGIIISQETIDKVSNMKVDSVKNQKAIEEIKDTLQKNSLKWKAGIYVNKMSNITVGFTKCEHTVSKTVRDIRRMERKAVFTCGRCKTGDVRHEKIAKLMSVKMKIKFLSLNKNKKGENCGFFYIDRNGDEGYIGTTLYNRFIKENGLSLKEQLA